MKKNSHNFLTTAIAAILFFCTSSVLFAQNNSEKNTITSVDADSSEVAEDAKKDQDYKLTVDKVDPTRFNSVAVIQGLNKITAKTSLLEIKIGDTIHFGKLTITALKCWQAPLEQKPESKILLEIYDTDNAKTSAGKSRIFYGWMFSSSPSVSALEHPIYDLTAVGCKNKS